MQDGFSNNKRCTVCITFAADGSKLPLILIFKGGINEPIANSLHRIMLAGMHERTQVNAWMGKRVIELSEEAVWKPYIQGSNKSVLLLDSMESHNHLILLIPWTLKVNVLFKFLVDSYL